MAAQHRSLANIERDIADARKWLSDLLRERQSAARSIRMKEMRHDPAFIEKMRQGTARAYANPDWLAKRRAASRNAALKQNALTKLPPMSKRELNHYRKVRRAGLTRADALREARLLYGPEA